VRGPIAITMGDPAGIGAEVALKALDRSRLSRRTPVLLLGDALLWAAAAKRFKTRTRLVPVSGACEAASLVTAVGVMDLGGPWKVRVGKVDAACGAAAVRYILAGVRLALKKQVRALVTAPIHKEAVHKAGYKFPGHTEMLSEWSRTKDYAMMMAGGPFKITLLSIHVPLRAALKDVNGPNLDRKIALTRKALMGWFGVKKPRLAVAGLNPHAGEGGAFGNEEIRVIAPAVKRARALGWDVTGPHPPDTLFHRVSRGEFDAVVAMYHDQGLIPIKLAAFEKGVNLTLGLPFVRTSPDHGTAFDIAGGGTADPSSMLEALLLAERLSL